MSQSIHKMQRYILGGVGLVSAMGLSFPIAMARVSATKEFSGQAVKSYDCASQVQKESKVIAWAKDCAPLKVEPKKAEAKPVEVKSVEAKPVVVTDKTAENTSKTEMLQLGMTGPEVVALQERLRSARVFEGPIDGIFGRNTEVAVQAMQEQLKLEPVKKD